MAITELKKSYVTPTLQVIALDVKDVLTVSGGGFEGEWDTNIPEKDLT